MSTWLLPLEALPAPSTGAAVLVALLVGAAGALYAYVTRHFGYWRRRGVPFLRPLPVAGNLKDVLLFRKHVGDVLHEVYTQMKELPYMGLFFYDAPVFFIKDAELFKNIVTNDFEYFQDRGFSPVKADLVFSETLFARKGDRWKDLRLKLNPAFTVTKLKRFYVLLQQKASNLDHYFDDAARKGEPCDVANACARYTMDAIATVGFGIETTALTDDNDPLHRLLRNIFVYSKLYLHASLATFVDMQLLRLLRLSLVPAPLAAFLRSTIWAAARERERTGTLGARRDILDLLLELRDKGRIAADEDTADGGDSGKRIADDCNGRSAVENGTAGNDKGAGSIENDMDGDVLIAQAFSVFSAGFDTTSSTMSFALYHLAKDQDIQDRLRRELQKVLHDNDGILTYDALQSVEYLDMIFSETLRLYPNLPFLDRTCTKNYNIPGTDIVIEKGVPVFGSLYGIQRDPEFFPDPDRFDPERFSAEKKANIPKSCFVPFGGGPRKCIGFKLAYLQGKLGLAHLILNYKFWPCAATPSKMEYNLHSFLLSPRNGVPLMCSRVEK
ncbi:hypothetical protein R5R35_000856 [Gryllus longicercus]|uniref:Cytochrome P450 n=1 Tax=Gryllus longicercus TaxID=2509291 RepID=A0AAN9Z4M0_9ORTH